MTISYIIAGNVFTHAAKSVKIKIMFPLLQLCNHIIQVTDIVAHLIQRVNFVHHIMIIYAVNQVSFKIVQLQPVKKYLMFQIIETISFLHFVLWQTDKCVPLIIQKVLIWEFMLLLEKKLKQFKHQNWDIYKNKMSGLMKLNVQKGVMIHAIMK